MSFYVVRVCSVFDREIVLEFVCGQFLVVKASELENWDRNFKDKSAIPSDCFFYKINV